MHRTRYMFVCYINLYVYLYVTKRSQVILAGPTFNEPIYLYRNHNVMICYNNVPIVIKKKYFFDIYIFFY